MAIDRGDWHFDDATTWERACRHIGLYLWWAAKRGLAPEHDAAAAAKAPTAYFIRMCDTKLWDEDFSAEGLAFTNAEYKAYLGEVSNHAEQAGIGDYDLPEDTATAAYFFAWLDESLAKWRAKPRRVEAASAARRKRPAKATKTRRAKAARTRRAKPGKPKRARPAQRRRKKTTTRPRKK